MTIQIEEIKCFGNQRSNIKSSQVSNQVESMFNHLRDLTASGRLEPYQRIDLTRPDGELLAC